MMRSIKNDKGVALAITLLVVVVILILGSAFIVRSVSEKSMSDRDRFSTHAFYVSDGGSQAGLNQLDTLINTNLLTTVTSTNPQTLANDAQSYVNTANGLGFLIKYCKSAGQAQLTLTGSQAKYAGTSTGLGSGTYRFDIYISQKGNPVVVATDQWDFPYYYRIESTGTVAGIAKKVALTGDFTVRVQRDNFAKYALFTDHHSSPSGSTVWFTNFTNFSGPLHTNDQYAFANNPSGTFYSTVTQQNTKGRFYNGGNPVQINASSNPPYDVPTFNSTYTRGAAEIVLASSVQKQDLIDQARADDRTTGNGIFVANSAGSVTGGIYVSGDATVDLSVDGSDRSVYTIVQGSTTKLITVDRVANQTSVQTQGVGTVTYNGLPDGVDDLGTIIYVNGQINSLAGTVQKDTEVTVSSENDIIITNNLKYADYTSASGTPGQPGYTPPNADGKTNLMGIVCWGGNVRVGTGAPNNIEIHGPIMARNGVFTVDNYDSGASRGTATVLGGVITQFYGPFGTFNGSTGQQATGYGRNFVYDNRMAVGKAPPYFPTMKTFVAFTNDLIDKITWQQGGF